MLPDMPFKIFAHNNFKSRGASTEHDILNLFDLVSISKFSVYELANKSGIYVCSVFNQIESNSNFK